MDSGPTAPTAQLDAEAGIAYLLQPESAAPPDVQYGEGTPVADPGFDYGDLRAWQATGATVETNERGQREAVVAVGGEQTITQQLTGLSPGRYVASVDVEVEPRKTRQASLTVTPAGGTAATNSIDRSTLRNTTASDEKHGTYFQPMRTVFEAGSGEAQLALRAAPGSGVVKFDNVRVAKLRDDVPIQPGQWDFENTDAGWGPFFRGDLPDSDANTHRSELHAPYTQRGWNGKAIDDVIGGRYSLKSFEYTPGISYRTTPASVRFQPGHRYRVSFDYENQLSGAYGWTLGADGPGGTKEISTTPFSAQTTSARHVQEFTADNCGDYWVGLKRLGPYEDQVEFALDGFTVEDLGPAADTARSRCG